MPTKNSSICSTDFAATFYPPRIVQAATQAAEFFSYKKAPETAEKERVFWISVVAYMVKQEGCKDNCSDSMRVRRCKEQNLKYFLLPRETCVMFRLYLFGVIIYWAAVDLRPSNMGTVWKKVRSDL